MSIAKAPATTDAHSQERAQASEVIPLVDLRAQHHSLEDELGLAFRRVVADCDFILGSAVGEFESAFAQWLGVEHAIGVGNGLDALTLALLALQVGPGDEVIVPANTFIATALAVSRIGARPVLVDCDPSTFNIDVAQIEGAITPRTRAVIPVHLTGQPAEMDPILAIAARHGLHVVEDAAQAHGATYHTRPCGTLGKVGCFSFYPGKNLGALGDAGLVCSNDPGIAQKVSWLRNYGQREKYIHVLQGVNSRMDTLQAAVLGIKLPRLRRWNEMRAAHARTYRELLAGVGDLQFQAEVPGGTHVYHLFIIQTENRDGLQRYLREQGIQTLIHYPIPIHLQPAYEQLGYRRGAFPAAERLADRMLSLPMFPEMQLHQLQRVVGAIRSWFAGARR